MTKNVWWCVTIESLPSRIVMLKTSFSDGKGDKLFSNSSALPRQHKKVSSGRIFHSGGFTELKRCLIKKFLRSALLRSRCCSFRSQRRRFWSTTGRTETGHHVASNAENWRFDAMWFWMPPNTYAEAAFGKREVGNVGLCECVCACVYVCVCDCGCKFYGYLLSCLQIKK